MPIQKLKINAWENKTKREQISYILTRTGIYIIFWERRYLSEENPKQIHINFSNDEIIWTQTSSLQLTNLVQKEMNLILAYDHLIKETEKVKE